MRLALLLTLLPSLTRADGPELHPWARFKPGAFVKLESGKPGERVTFLHTLKSVGDGYYELEYTIDAGKPKLERHRFGEAVPAIDSEAKKEGQDSIKIGARTIPCTLWRWSGRRDTTTSVDIQECRASGIAIPVKLTIKTVLYGMPVLETYVATHLGENVKVAGRTFRCVRLEGTTEVGNKPIAVTRWATLDVPGGYVKETRMQDGKLLASSEIVAFKP